MPQSISLLHLPLQSNISQQSLEAGRVSQGLSWVGYIHWAIIPEIHLLVKNTKAHHSSQDTKHKVEKELHSSDLLPTARPLTKGSKAYQSSATYYLQHKPGMRIFQI